MTIPDDFRKQVANGGLRFQAYLPPSLASRVVDLVEQGAFIRHLPKRFLWPCKPSKRWKGSRAPRRSQSLKKT